MDVKERAHDFRFVFGEDSDGEQVCIALTGVNPELGQTLASTGLTVWRAAQEMARFMWEHRQWFVGKRVVELGAGLGLCGVLASKLCTGGTVVITDGGDEFTESAMDALRKNLEKNSCNLVAASSPPTGDDGASCARGDGHSGGGGGGAARVVLEKLTWGDHAGFLERYGGGSSFSGAAVDDNDDRRRGTGREGFDFIVAADVIYEEEGVSPLLHTVVDILRLREAGRDGDGSGHGQSQISTAEAAAEDDQQRKQQSQESGLQEKSSTTPPAVSTFLLAFARRNISIERVLEEAESLGLAWRLPDDFEPASASENVYLMTLR
ncbi:unnamed protein product [Scytosiphon promiscuus]